MANRPITIAYAEDHEMVRAGIVSLLQLAGDMQVVIQAADGQELIDALHDADNKPDVCLLDVEMPVKNGCQTATEIKEQWPDIKVLAVSQHDAEAVVGRMMLSGADGYVSKLAKATELFDAIRTVHSTDMYFSPLMTRPLLHALKNNMKHLPSFTQQEEAMLRQCGSDKTYADIATAMNVATRTVEGYRDSLYRKTGVKSRAGLVVFAVQHGFIPVHISSIGFTA